MRPSLPQGGDFVEKLHKKPKNTGIHAVNWTCQKTREYRHSHGELDMPENPGYRRSRGELDMPQPKNTGVHAVNWTGQNAQFHANQAGYMKILPHPWNFVNGIVGA